MVITGAESGRAGLHEMAQRRKGLLGVLLTAILYEQSYTFPGLTQQHLPTHTHKHTRAHARQGKCFTYEVPAVPNWKQNI